MIDKETIHKVLSSLWKNDTSVGALDYNQALQDAQTKFDLLSEEPISEDLEEGRKLGRQFAPKVECSVYFHKEHWCGNMGIGDFYYEAEPWSKKEHVVGEIVGCMEKIKEQIDKELEELKEKESKV